MSENIINSIELEGVEHVFQDQRVDDNMLGYSLDETGTGLTFEKGIGVGVVFSDLDYSEEEQVTGKRWIDGKPVYELSFSGILQGGFEELPIATNAEVLVNQTISFKEPGGGSSTNCYRNWTTSNVCINSVMEDRIIIWSQNLVGREYSATIQYTKTTDTAQSPVKPSPRKEMHTYDGTEKVVGTWFGKPLYEKSYVIDHGFSLTSNAFTNIVACDIPIKQLVFHSIADPTLSMNLTLAIFSNGYIQGASTWPGSLNINANAVLTIQYTKTTD